MLRKYLNKNRIDKGIEIEDSMMNIDKEEESVLESPFEKKGLFIMWCVVILSISGLIVRVFYLDFFKREYYSEIAKGNKTRSIIIKAPRGLIFDKNENILARNIPSIDVIIIPRDLPDDATKRKEAANELANILEMNSGNVEIILDSQDRKSLNPILLKSNISQDQALLIAEKKDRFMGVELEKTAIRSYDNSVIFSSIIGYDGKITREELKNNPDYLMTDYIGKAGLEKYYEKEIKGKHGATKVEVDSLGNMKRTIGFVNPIAGNDLILNIDEGLQKIIYDSLGEILEKTKVKTAAAVAIDPRNGGVLAMVSMPSYDNNLFAKGITNEEFQVIIKDKDLPLLNRSVAGEYPPGSTFKPAVAAAALMEKTITADMIVNDSQGAIFLGKWRFGDWKTHGVVDMREAIAQSCDVYFYSIGGGYGNIEGLGIARIKKYSNLFGFGNITGIDIPGEAKGLIPDENWKLDKIGEKWYIGNTYHASIGQGYVTATPVQLANYTASIANDGTLYSPRIVNRIKKNDGTENIIKSEVLNHNFIKPEVIKIIKEGMRKTVVSGTARSLNDLGVEVAGKTGTAQFGNEDKTHSWFIAFAPYEKPEIAMVVLVEGGGEGNSAALPVTRDALKWFFEKNKE